jgi:hypothetical protein
VGATTAPGSYEYERRTVGASAVAGAGATTCPQQLQRWSAWAAEVVARMIPEATKAMSLDMLILHIYARSHFKACVRRLRKDHSQKSVSLGFHCLAVCEVPIGLIETSV